MTLRAAEAGVHRGKTPQHAPNFDRVARLYRWAEYVALGPLLRLAREQHLPQIASAKHAFILGDGDGRFTAELLARAPQIFVLAVDTSAAMLRLLRQRCERQGAGPRLRVEHSSALSSKTTPNTDVVITHFFLDCLTQPQVDQLVSRIASEVQPGCLWVVSDFGLPRNRAARPFAAAYIRLLYAAFRVLTGLRTRTLPDPQASLREAGFTLCDRKERLGGFLYSELWQLEPRKEYKRDTEASRGATSFRTGTSTCT